MNPIEGARSVISGKQKAVTSGLVGGIGLGPLVVFGLEACGVPGVVAMPAGMFLGGLASAWLTYLIPNRPL